jgi:hypothetical protein
VTSNLLAHRALVAAAFNDHTGAIFGLFMFRRRIWVHACAWSELKTKLFRSFGEPRAFPMMVVRVILLLYSTCDFLLHAQSTARADMHPWDVCIDAYGTDSGTKRWVGQAFLCTVHRVITTTLLEQSCCIPVTLEHPMAILFTLDVLSCETLVPYDSGVHRQSYDSQCHVIKSGH